MSIFSASRNAAFVEKLTQSVSSLRPLNEDIKSLAKETIELGTEYILVGDTILPEY